MTTADVIAHTKSLGVARTQAFEALTQLEAGGVIERRRRALVGAWRRQSAAAPRPSSKAAVPLMMSAVGSQTLNTGDQATPKRPQRGRLVRSVGAHPIETAASVGMIAIGFIIASPIAGVSAWVGVLGNLLVVMGGVLFSWTTATWFATDAASEEMRRQLVIIGQHLGTVSSQIRQAVVAFGRNETDAETHLALITQATHTLYGLVNDVSVITGSPFAAEDFLQTVEYVESLASELAEFAESSAPEAEKAGQLAEVRSQISAVREQLAAPLGTSVRIQETSSCPECSQPVTFALGTQVGESAVGVCPHCGARFHGHRMQAGAVVTRRWLSSARVREVKLTCTHCHSAFVMSVVEGDTETKTRYCLSCGSRLAVDVVAGEVTQAVPQEILVGEVLRQDLGRWILSCPGCNGELRSFFRSQDTAYGVCSVDRALVRATLVTPAAGAAAHIPSAAPSTAASPGAGEAQT